MNMASYFNRNKKGFRCLTLSIFVCDFTLPGNFVAISFYSVHRRDHTGHTQYSYKFFSFRCFLLGIECLTLKPSRFIARRTHILQHTRQGRRNKRHHRLHTAQDNTQATQATRHTQHRARQHTQGTRYTRHETHRSNKLSHRGRAGHIGPTTRHTHRRTYTTQDSHDTGHTRYRTHTTQEHTQDPHALRQRTHRTDTTQHTHTPSNTELKTNHNHHFTTEQAIQNEDTAVLSKQSIHQVLLYLDVGEV